MPQPESEPATKTKKYAVVRHALLRTSDGGWEVNDSHTIGEVEIVCKKQVYNEGTDARFVRYYPTSLQLARATGFKRCRWELYGEDFEADKKRSAKPVGSLRFLGESNED